MAETVHLYLKANGADIQGESSQTSLGRENSIECLSFHSDVKTAREAGSGMATGRRTYEPLFIESRIDKAVPLLMKALTTNAKIDAQFKFFRPSLTGDGTTEQFYTIEIKNGRIASLKQKSMDVFNPAAANIPPTYEMTFVFHSIVWTYTNGGVTHEDTWNTQT